MAEHLHLPVGEMLRRMDSRELAEWQAFFAIRKDAENPKPVKAGDQIRAMFAHRVKKTHKE